MSSQSENYERQFWGFSAKELSTGLRNVILENIQDIIDGIHQSLKKRTPEEVWPALLSSCQTLHNEYLQNATEHLRTVEAYIQENFSIPPHVLLEEDSVQRQQYSDEERENMDRELKDLWRRINRVHFMEHHLLELLDKNKNLKAISEKVKELSLPQVDLLHNNKQLQHLFLESVGLEVQAANCHMKDEDSNDSNGFNQPNFPLEAFKKR